MSLSSTMMWPAKGRTGGRLGDPLVRSVVEPKPGIAAARNRVLDETAAADLLVFIDDDERPTAEWLAHLLETFDRSPGAGVVGPVVSEYEHVPEEWITKGGFFSRS